MLGLFRDALVTSSRYPCQALKASSALRQMLFASLCARFVFGCTKRFVVRDTVVIELNPCSVLIVLRAKVVHAGIEPIAATPGLFADALVHRLPQLIGTGG